jgi:hypothetical protein
VRFGNGIKSAPYRNVIVSDGLLNNNASLDIEQTQANNLWIAGAKIVTSFIDFEEQLLP